jgi:hypothetical protein
MYRSSLLLDGTHHTEALIYKYCSYKHKTANMSFQSQACVTITCCVSEQEQDIMSE